MELYHYKIDKIIKVVDGDTIVCDIDLGMSVILRKQRIRFLFVDTPSIKTEDGKKCKLFLEDLLMKENQEIYIKTVKDRNDKYGRYLGEIFIKKGEEIINVNNIILENGYKYAPSK